MKKTGKTAKETKEEVIEQSVENVETGNSTDHSEDTDKATEEEYNPIDKLQAELGSLNDKYLRLIAEFDNFKKRAAKEKIEIRLTAGRDILEDLLPVLDDLDRAHEAVSRATDIRGVKEGFDLIKDKLLKNLATKGLKEMEVIGEIFDADRHEAVAEFPAQSEEQKGKILDVTTKGYVLNDRIIRFPKVVVNK